MLSESFFVTTTFIDLKFIWKVRHCGIRRNAPDAVSHSNLSRKNSYHQNIFPEISVSCSSLPPEHSFGRNHLVSRTQNSIIYVRRQLSPLQSNLARPGLSYHL